MKQRMCLVVGMVVGMTARGAAAQSQAFVPIDFSFAGYHAGDAPLPLPDVSRSLSPSGGDDSDRIQSALDAVGQLPLNASGHRGAVLLKSGIFHVRKPLFISESGVVLRGSGSGAGGTHLRLGGTPRDGIVVRGGGARPAGSATSCISPSIEPGATAVRVRSPSLFRPYQDIRISRPIYSDGGPKARAATGNNQPLGWQRFDRTILSIMGDTLMLDAPLTDRIDAQVLGAGQVIVQPMAQLAPLREVGIESLSAGAAPTPGDMAQPHFRLALFDRVTDAWVDDVATVNLAAGVVSLGPETRRITVSRAASRRNHVVPLARGYPFDFLVEGQQILLEDIDCEGDDVAFVGFGPLTTGPNVVRQLEGHGNARAIVGPLAPWVSGVLFEHLFLPGSTLGLGWGPTRDGSPHWVSTQSMIYNSTAKNFAVSHPPQGDNFCLGCSGRVVPGPDKDAFVAQDTVVEPQSLFLYQREQRH